MQPFGIKTLEIITCKIFLLIKIVAYDTNTKKTSMTARNQLFTLNLKSRFMKNNLQSVLLKSVTNPLIFTMLIFSVFIGCKKDDTSMQSQVDARAQEDLMAKWGPPNIIVHKGESIQAAVNKAKAGMTIFIEPGVYRETILVDKQGIKLIGKLKRIGDEVIIKNPGDEENGIEVTGNGDGFTLANVTIKEFSDNGVFLNGADNYVISHVKAINNKEYGIFPVHCNNGLIEFCIATGSADTGIYVGQSTNVKMQFNTAYANVIGLEVENSSFVDVEFNSAYNNVAGIMVDVLPGHDIKTCSNINVRSNRFYNNNHENFGDTAELESSVPVGSGVIILGADQTVVEGNTVTGNDFTGIVVFSTLVLSVIAGVPPEEILSDIEPNPDGNIIVRNTLRNNGSNPPEIPGLPLPGVDLLYDGSGTNNCWKNNIFKTSSPSPLPACN